MSSRNRGRRPRTTPPTLEQEEGEAMRPPLLPVRISLGGTNVCGLRALLALRHLVGHLLPLIEVPETLTRYRAEVHEHVSAAVVGRDEPEALLGAEPLDGACCHVRSLLPSPSGPCCIPVRLRLAPGGNRSWRTMINCPR